MVTAWSSCEQDVDDVRDAVSAILTDLGPAGVDATDGFGPGWDALVKGGYLFVPADPAEGGTLAEALAVVEEAGRHAVRGPVAEHGILAGWVLERAGLPVPEGPLTFAPAPGVREDRGRLFGTVPRVPWAQDVHRIVLLVDSPDGPAVAMIDPRELAIQAGGNLASERRDTITLDGAAVIQQAPAPGFDELEARAALTRAALICGAAARAVGLTLRYTKERHQFGRPVGRFQAVQAHLVTAAQQVRAAQVATRSAAMVTTFEPEKCQVEAAVAKIVASHAAGVVAAATHQATGAMGMTKEYELGHLTLKLWSWRDECGSEAVWSRRLGERLVAGGAEGYWPLIAGDAVAAAAEPVGSR
ncbi:hypothetical protein SD37_09475 [Amycolatopsis orientalis]|uniref:Acyl-CoA dehydrogenase/oxidase C-terminal domain-containing protein n=1 Tax=Amycolatopsis orientalis TaxID=31958 RepID=A0A193BUG1_AMYOR|nr:acyl-CoA dehydrogenase family protein [Amycolatopsis orientalis]ANN15852.1 hypothetical protein SD37_09475 [Amycolatopsis orientalis]